MVHLGVFLRFLNFLMDENTPHRLSSATLKLFITSLAAIKNSTPCEFNRKVKERKIKRTGHHFKATELRRMGLYDCLKAFKDVLPENLYKLYLLFQSGVYILSSPRFYRTHNGIAKVILREFVSHAQTVFGRQFIVYNVHSLIHMADECLSCDGPLDAFSAFKFENYLKTVRDILHSGYKPLQQLANKVRETRGQLTNPTRRVGQDEVRILNPHTVVGEEMAGRHFAKLETRGITLNLRDADCCFLTDVDEVVLLSNIIRTPTGDIFLAGHKFLDCRDFYDYPLPSSDLGIMEVSNREGQKRYWRLDNFAQKVYLIRGVDSHLCIPLLHSV